MEIGQKKITAAKLGIKGKIFFISCGLGFLALGVYGSDYIGTNGHAFTASEESASSVNANYIWGTTPSGARRPNPDMGFLQKIFCRGRKTSSFCTVEGYRSGDNYLHPYYQWWSDWAARPDVDLDARGKHAAEMEDMVGKVPNSL